MLLLKLPPTFPLWIVDAQQRPLPEYPYALWRGMKSEEEAGRHQFDDGGMVLRVLDSGIGADYATAIQTAPEPRASRRPAERFGAAAFLQQNGVM